MRSKRRVYIRADGGAEIGLGHLIRCIALAKMVQTEFELVFVLLEAPQEIRDEISTGGFSLLEISSEDDFIDVLKRNEFVVIDHYGIGSEYQKKIKSKGCILLCVDDLHDKKFYADLIINHSPGVSKNDYSTAIYTQFALGLEYALLRPAFLTAAKSDRKIGTKKSIFICFGGSDPNNLTQKALEVTLSLVDFERVVVVTGASYKFGEELQVVVSGSDLTEWYRSVTEHKMAELMLSCEVAIVPASGILIEAIACGCLTVSGMYMQNQRFLFEELKKSKVIISAEGFNPDSTKEALKTALKSSTVSLPFSSSDENIFKLFKQLELQSNVDLRAAELRDLEATYTWAQDMNIRRYSFNQDVINYEEHKRWFFSKINDPGCFYYIAILDDSPIGSIRFDLHDIEFVVSYLVDSTYHGKGVGTAILTNGLKKLLDEVGEGLQKVVGWVNSENVASCRIFEKLRFNRELDGGYYKYTILID